MIKLIFLYFFILFSAFQMIGQDMNTISQKEESIERGYNVYKKDCKICHKPDGLGKSNKYPPLANSDWLFKNPAKAIEAIKYGLEGEIIVNGVSYNEKMKPRSLSDQQIADVMNYILNSWGNSYDNTIQLSDIIQKTE